MNSYHIIKDFARANRKNPTPSEAIFWHNARGKKIGGYKFLRQHVIAYQLYENQKRFFIADFYCEELRLVVEIDGRIHEYQKEYDKDRSEILEGIRLKVIRFTNDDVLVNWDMVEKTILSITHP